MPDSCPEVSRTDHLPALHAALLASHSATEVLERFYGAPVTASRISCPKLAPTEEQSRRLQLAPGEPWAHRRVALCSAGRTLSHADLWYVPRRLESGMVLALETTDRPFGHIVRPLGPRRITLSTWLSGPDEPPGLEHRALLTIAGLAGPLPIAEVHERYGAGGSAGV